LISSPSRFHRSFRGTIRMMIVYAMQDTPQSTFHGDPWRECSSS
jgi:hypothetical protein